MSHARDRKALDPTRVIKKADWLDVRDGLIATLVNLWQPGVCKNPSIRLAATRDALESLELLRHMMPDRCRRAQERDQHAIMARVRAAQAQQREERQRALRSVPSAGES